MISSLGGDWIIGRFTEVAGESLDSANVCTCSSSREVTSSEFLQHYFAKTGHRDHLYVATTSSESQ